MFTSRCQLLRKAVGAGEKPRRRRRPGRQANRVVRKSCSAQRNKGEEVPADSRTPSSGSDKRRDTDSFLSLSLSLTYHCQSAFYLHLLATLQLNHFTNHLVIYTVVLIVIDVNMTFSKAFSSQHA